MTASGHLEAAERFIRTAYSRAKLRPRFRTFQIDTYALRLFLLIETKSKDVPTVVFFEEITDKLDKVRRMLREESHRYHAIRVLEGIEPFVLERISVLTAEEKAALIQYLGLVIRDLDQLSGDIKLETGSETIRNSINRARERIIRDSSVV